jgi:uncharacterized membrane protein YeiH
MAATAAIQGARQGFDPFGAVVLAIVTAIGGGTLRDLLIGSTPVFWLTDMTYLATAVPIGLATYFLSKSFGQQNGKRLRFLLYLDAIGLALFTLVGIQSALAAELPMASVVVLGCLTGVAGGMFRDVLCGLTPAILKQDLYATVSLAGGIIYLVSRDHIDETTALILAFAFMICLRSIVVFRNRKTTD